MGRMASLAIKAATRNGPGYYYQMRIGMKTVKYLMAIIMVGVFFSACTSSKSNPADETKVKGVVEGFGQRLKRVSLLSPSAPEDIKAQYSEYVSNTVLEQWMSSPETAPGRIVSSPWPDRIEITSVKKTTSNAYSVAGNVIEITSRELNAGGYADKMPVQIKVQKSDDRWLIVNFVQEQSHP